MIMVSSPCGSSVLPPALAPTAEGEEVAAVVQEVFCIIPSREVLIDEPIAVVEKVQVTIEGFFLLGVGHDYRLLLRLGAISHMISEILGFESTKKERGHARQNHSSPSGDMADASITVFPVAFSTTTRRPCTSPAMLNFSQMARQLKTSSCNRAILRIHRSSSSNGAGSCKFTPSPLLYFNGAIGL